MKAIETRYKGYRFRSRLEARWAVFFDALGVEWVYEPEGFDLDEAGYYLPDFWLPQVKMWAEVKPVEFNTEEYNKAAKLALFSGFSVLMLVGTPEDKPYNAIERDSDGGWYTDVVYSATDTNECAYCLTMYHDYPIAEGRFYGNPGGEGDSHYPDTAAAAAKARAARFEYGEGGL